MQKQHSKDLLHRHVKILQKNVLFHVLFWLENEMRSLARTEAPSSIVRKKEMQDGGVVAQGRWWEQKDCWSALKFHWAARFGFKTE